MSAQDWIHRLDLTPHPEGGWYREVYRATETIPADGLPDRFDGPRSCSTSIYYLLERGQFSAFHRIRSDELWHFYDGDPLEIVMFGQGGGPRVLLLGRVGDAQPQVVVPANHWFGARCPQGSDYTLCGCTVAPGFDFADFEMAARGQLEATYPAHKRIIRELTHG